MEHLGRDVNHVYRVRAALNRLPGPEASPTAEVEDGEAAWVPERGEVQLALEMADGGGDCEGLI